MRASKGAASCEGAALHPPPLRKELPALNHPT